MDVGDDASTLDTVPARHFHQLDGDSLQVRKSQARPSTDKGGGSKPTAGHNLSAKTLLDTLSGLGETVLIYPSTGGRPKARRMTTDMTTEQKALYSLSDLNQWAPTPTYVTRTAVRHTALTSSDTHHDQPI